MSFLTIDTNLFIITKMSVKETNYSLKKPGFQVLILKHFMKGFKFLKHYVIPEQNNGKEYYVYCINSFI